jgi:hypothetical protein
MAIFSCDKKVMLFHHSDWANITRDCYTIN